MFVWHGVAWSLVFPSFTTKEMILGGWWSKEQEEIYGTD